MKSIHLNKLLDFFRSKVFYEVANKEHFLLSMIPFMRGYAQIVNLPDEKNQLTQLMHGYNDIKIDLVKIFNNLFGISCFFIGKFEITAKDISDFEIDKLTIFKNTTSYKLLNKTLKHTFMYLYLRLNVERTLVEIYDIDTKKHDMLTNIIVQAFKGSSQADLYNRVFLTSKKTLLNDFNHFEGNMNIFQPAIDITDSSLNKEKNDIINFLEEIREKHTVHLQNPVLV
jgi:hypothetical protein